MYITEDRYYYDDPARVYSVSRPELRFIYKDSRLKTPSDDNAVAECIDTAKHVLTFYDPENIHKELFEVKIEGRDAMKIATINAPTEEACVKFSNLSINLRSTSESVSHGVKYSVKRIEGDFTLGFDHVYIASPTPVFILTGENISLSHVNVYSVDTVIGSGCEDCEIGSDSNVVLGPGCKHVSVGEKCSDIIIGANTHNVEIGNVCSSVEIGPESGHDGRIVLYDDVHHVHLPAHSADKGQVIIEAGCGAKGGKLIVKGACAQGTVLKAKNEAFAEGKVIINGHENDDIFLDGVDEGVFE